MGTQGAYTSAHPPATGPHAPVFCLVSAYHECTGSQPLSPDKDLVSAILPSCFGIICFLFTASFPWACVCTFSKFFNLKITKILPWPQPFPASTLHPFLSLEWKSCLAWKLSTAAISNSFSPICLLNPLKSGFCHHNSLKMLLSRSPVASLNWKVNSRLSWPINCCKDYFLLEEFLHVTSHTEFLPNSPAPSQSPSLLPHLLNFWTYTQDSVNGSFYRYYFFGDFPNFYLQLRDLLNLIGISNLTHVPCC